MYKVLFIWHWLIVKLLLLWTYFFLELVIFQLIFSYMPCNILMILFKSVLIVLKMFFLVIRRGFRQPNVRSCEPWKILLVKNRENVVKKSGKYWINRETGKFRGGSFFFLYPRLVGKGLQVYKLLFFSIDLNGFEFPENKIVWFLV